MHVLFAIKSVCQRGGGAERVLATVMGGIAKTGVQVTLLTHDRPTDRSFYPLSEAIDWVRVPIGEVNRTTTLRNLMVRVPALRREVRALKPDIVVAFMHSMYAPMAFAMVGLDIPLIASEHTAREHYRSRPFEYVLANVAALRTAHVTVVSDRIQRDFGYLLRRRMVPIRNPVDLPVPSSEGIRTNTILSVGRLGPEKDHATLIRAFARISRKVPDWTLRIVGEGEEEESLRRLTSQLSIEDRVILPGAVEAIQEEYQRAAIFVTPSRYESFGLATIEAMATGLPVIGFADCPGTNQIVRDRQTGLLVKSSNRVESLAIALQELVNDRSLREDLGASALSYASSYSSESILTDWRLLIDECFARWKERST